MNVKAGDWVSFLLGGKIVYGQVEYIIERKSWERAPTVVSTAGEISVESVLEIRVRGEATR